MLCIPRPYLFTVHRYLISESRDSIITLHLYEEDYYMDTPIVDFETLEELSAGEPRYKYDILEIFIGTVDEGMANLEALIGAMKKFDAIYKQAHALKSPSGIVKVRDMHPRLTRLEIITRAIAEKKAAKADHADEIKSLMAELSGTYQQARPVLLAEKEKFAPKE